MYKDITNELLSLVQKSPNCFHAVSTMKDMLLEDGYTKSWEYETWTLEKGGKYFITRNGSSLVVLHVGNSLEDYHFQVTLSHSDSPTSKIKEEAVPKGKGGYLQLNMEGYGGTLYATWVDRPLSLTGRVPVREGNTFTSRLVSFDRDLLPIPNATIHMNRGANNGTKYNNQIDMLLLFSAGECNEGDYIRLLADELGRAREDILGTDLYLMNHMAPSIWGVKEEFISSPKLDDLQCVFTSLKALLHGTNEQAVNAFACSDNEEVGSGTRQGACSTFLHDVLQRINDNLGYIKEDYYRVVAKSFVVSYDSAYAVYPNHPEKTDDTNCIYMNKGIVVKFSANQKYTADVVSPVVFAGICEKAEAPAQHFANRSDVAGGSTLGNLSSQKVSMYTVGIGLAQLATYSSYEIAGIRDSEYMTRALTTFYNTNLYITDSETIEVAQVSMKNQNSQKKIHIDNLYLMKRLDEDYHKEFIHFYDYVPHSNVSDVDINIIVNIALEQYFKGMKNRKKATLVIPRDLEEYTTELSRGNVYKDMKRKIHDQDYEKIQISSIWYVFSLCIVLFLFKNLMDQESIVNYLVDVIVACVAGGIAMKNSPICKRIAKRYQFGSFYMHMDIIAIVVCALIKIVIPAVYASFDITYLLLVISSFVMKRKIKPQLEAAIQQT